ncbi:MAG: hypothetical protein ABIJ75_02455 [Actinomycetota bacterium]
MGVTLDAVIDRLYRDHLYPPNQQPAQTTLNGALTNVATAVTLTDNVLTQAEEDAIGAGTLLEVDRELMRVTAVGTWPALTVTRGALGTTAAAHDTLKPVIVTPLYPRSSVFDAVCDSIEALNDRDIFTIATSDTFTATDSLTEVPATVIEVLSVHHRIYEASTTTTGYRPGSFEFLKDQPTDVSSTTKAIQLYGIPVGHTTYYVYKTYFTRPTDETYDLTDDAPNMPERFIKLITLGALIDLLAGADLDARSVEYITEALNAQGFPVGSGRDLVRSMVTVYEYRLEQAARRLNRDYPMTVEQMDAIL